MAIVGNLVSNLVGPLVGQPSSGGGGSSGTLLDDLVAWWELNEESGVRFDSHNSYDLTDNNTCGFAAGLVGNSVSLIKENNETLSNTHADLNLPVEMTLSTWLKMTPLPAGNDGFVSQASGSSSFRWELSHFGGTYQYRYRGTLSATQTINFGTVITGGVWQHLVITYSHTTDLMQMYLNNSASPTGDISAISTIVGTYPTELGRRGASHSSDFTGEIDETAMWSRVLTASEITSLYNGGSGIGYPG